MLQYPAQGPNTLDHRNVLIGYLRNTGLLCGCCILCFPSNIGIFHIFDRETVTDGGNSFNHEILKYINSTSGLSWII